MSALEEAVANRLDRPLDELPLLVDGDVQQQDGVFVARFVIGGEIEDSRVLSSPNCVEVTEAVAVVVARLAATLPVPPKAKPVEVVAAVQPERISRFNGGIRGAGLVGTGATPGVGIAGDLGAWMSWRSWAIAISAARWKSELVTLDGTMSGASVAVGTAIVRLGWQPDDGILRAWGVAELGSIRGTGVELEEGRTGSARWSAIGAGAGLAWHARPHVAVVSSVETEFSLNRAKFTTDSGDVLYRTPAVGLRGTLALELAWR